MSTTKIEKIKAQLEFYFSDANYTKDHFLQSTCASDNGYIPITVLLKFQKLRNLEATKEEVIESIKDSKVVEEKDEKIKKIITDEYKLYLAEDVAGERIVAVRGFPVEYSLDDIRVEMAKHCNVVLIRMRRDKKKRFNGDILLETGNKDEAMSLIGKKIEVDSIAEENEKGKKMKIDPFILSVLGKADFLNEEERKKMETNDKKSYQGMIFNYKIDNDVDITTVKRTINNCAFVDRKNKIVRFNEKQDFEEKEFKADNIAIKLIALNEKEAKQYVKDNIKGKVTKKRRN